MVPLIEYLKINNKEVVLVVECCGKVDNLLIFNKKSLYFPSKSQFFAEVDNPCFYCG